MAFPYSLLFPAMILIDWLSGFEIDRTIGRQNMLEWRRGLLKLYSHTCILGDVTAERCCCCVCGFFFFVALVKLIATLFRALVASSNFDPCKSIFLFALSCQNFPPGQPLRPLFSRQWDSRIPYFFRHVHSYMIPCQPHCRKKQFFDSTGNKQWLDRTIRSQLNDITNISTPSYPSHQITT